MKKIRTYLPIAFSIAFLLISLKMSAQCTISFNTAINANGNLTFTSTSVPTSSATVYNWNFGSSTFTATGNPTASVTYTANGNYTITLSISGCSVSSTQTVNVTNVVAPCNVNANFSYAQGTNGSVTFTSTSTGTVSGTTYYWAYGDAGTGTGAISSHTYPFNGSFNVVLHANNNYTPTCIDSVTVQVNVTTYPCVLNAAYNFTTGANGLVNFASVSTGTVANTTYTWNFGDSNSGTGINTNHVYANGTYVATLYAMNGFSSCIGTATHVVTVASASCNLNSNFSYSQGTNGAVNFTSTSTGTVPGTTYSWNYGDLTPGGNGSTTSHTYSANGNYNVLLYANNNFSTSCTDSVIIQITVSTLSCGLNPNYSYTVGSGNSVNFSSTSTGTIAGSVYYWQFGDASTATGNPSTHNYATTGTYIATLTVINNSATCYASVVDTVIVLPVPVCSLTTGFTHTVGAGGVVNFASAATGTIAGTTYYWNFGDGHTASGNTTTHTYASAGAYNVFLLVSNTPSCKDSIIQSVNVTGISCIANPNFSITPTSTAQVWNATPYSPWNVVAANWSWGDNSSSNTLYTSHSYSAAGNYSICLSVTVSCGAMSTACNTSYIYRTSTPALQMVHINVTAPSVVSGIEELNTEVINYDVYPNPNNGQFELKVNNFENKTITIKLYNLVGQILYESEMGSGSTVKRIELDDISNGVYFIRLGNAGNEYTKKIIINK